MTTNKTSNRMPSWQRAALASIVSMGVAGAAYAWPTSPLTWIAAFGVAVFGIAMWFSPETWYRRMSATSLGLSGSFSLVPAIKGSGRLDLSYLTRILHAEAAGQFLIDNSPGAAIVLAIVALGFAVLDRTSDNSSLIKRKPLLDLIKRKPLPDLNSPEYFLAFIAVCLFMVLAVGDAGAELITATVIVFLTLFFTVAVSHYVFWPMMRTRRLSDYDKGTLKKMARLEIGAVRGKKTRYISQPIRVSSEKLTTLLEDLAK